MQPAQRDALKRLLDDDKVKFDTTTEETTTANVGAFAVPLGPPLRRQTPVAISPVAPLWPTPVVEYPFNRRRLRKRQG